MIRAIVVDDEPLAREKIRGLLSLEQGVELIAECASAAEALEVIRQHSPDLVFLDVQMPKMNGFEMLAQVEGEMPAVVFVTAYDRYALRAFEVHALDYLLKPFDRERFQKALRRVRAQVEGTRPEELQQKLFDMLREVSGKKYLQRLAVRSGGRISFVRIAEVDWIEAAGNYVRLHAGGESYLHRETMSNMEGKLDPDVFVRIHRSTIVNVDRVKGIETKDHRDHYLLLRNGTRLPLGPAFRDQFRKLLEEQ